MQYVQNEKAWIAYQNQRKTGCDIFISILKRKTTLIYCFICNHIECRRVWSIAKFITFKVRMINYQNIVLEISACGLLLVKKFWYTIGFWTY